MATQAYTNGYNPFQFTDLSGGLNLRDKSDAVGEKEAVDLLNVTFTERGAVRQRDGYHRPDRRAGQPRRQPRRVLHRRRRPATDSGVREPDRSDQPHR